MFDFTRVNRLTSRPATAALLAAIALFSAPVSTTAQDASPGLLAQPKSPSKAEAQFLARLNKALAPIRNYRLSAGDKDALRDAFAAVSKRRSKDIAAHRERVGDRVARKLIDWWRLRSGLGSARDYKTFLDENPAWPSRDKLWERMEEELFDRGGSPNDVASYFKNGKPTSGIGLAALASAHLRAGNDRLAQQLTRDAWRGHEIPSNYESRFLKRLGHLLRAEDHAWKLDRLIIDNIRWTGQRKRRAAEARRIIALLPKSEQAQANARLRVFLTRGKARPTALNAADRQDWGAQFHKIQSLRKQGKLSQATNLLLKAPTDPDEIANLDEWWEERRINAYLALKANRPKLAYALVRDAGPLTVNPYKEQQFMAGWLALRYLKDARQAAKHFAIMAKAADGPLSHAKSNYWVGRAAEALGDTEKARRSYQASARNSDTFHGLLSMQKLQRGPISLNIKPPQSASNEQIQRFIHMDAVQAVGIANKADLPANVKRAFIYHLRTVFSTEAEVALVAHLAEMINDTQLAVRTAKKAIASGYNLHIYSYPVHPFPAYRPLSKPAEPAYLLAIARQETEFNSLTVSGAGAKGFLQVMSITAKHVCRDYKIKCDLNRLLKDVRYNTTIGAAYISDRMREFSGSYILGATGYNAGPGRSRQWIREFGDPRDPKIDPIDWIERIPIKETRQYVAKVLSNLQIYRARLGQEPALRLNEDLLRGRRR